MEKYNLESICLGVLDILEKEILDQKITEKNCFSIEMINTKNIGLYHISNMKSINKNMHKIVVCKDLNYFIKIYNKSILKDLENRNPIINFIENIICDDNDFYIANYIFILLHEIGHALDIIENGLLIIKYYTMINQLLINVYKTTVKKSYIPHKLKICEINADIFALSNIKLVYNTLKKQELI